MTKRTQITPTPINPCENQGQMPSIVLVLFVERREKFSKESSSQFFLDEEQTATLI